MRFEIARSKSSNGGFFWRAVARNGQTLATSEIYTTKAAAKKTIEGMKKKAADAEVRDLTDEAGAAKKAIKKAAAKKAPAKTA